MLIKATTKYVRMSPEKLRLVLTGLKPRHTINDIYHYLMSSEQKGGAILAKTLKQAIYNAKNNFGKSEKELKIKNIQIDKASVLKRFRAVSRGSAHSILKRNSHITIILEAKEEKDGTQN